MKAYCCIIAIVISLILPHSSYAETFCVSDATELQDALTTAASNGEDDTIQIEQGECMGSFMYVSTEAYALTIEGGYASGCSSRDVDSANTVLDGNGAGSVLVFSTLDTDANLEVDGLTLQNGVAGNGYGGGIYANTDGNITISNSTIGGNEANLGAAGVHVEYSGNITFTNNTITRNLANGGVAVNSSGSITFTDNSITENSGSGIYARSNGSITFSNNTITGNSSSMDGGGVHAISDSASVTFTNNTIIDNWSDAYGGGAYVASHNSATFTNNTITGNSSSMDGGGNGGGVCVYTASSSGLIFFTSNTITGNSAYDDYGGGLYVSSFNSTSLTNNTITGNSACEGGGIYLNPQNFSNTSTTLTNNIITDNQADDSGGGVFAYSNSVTFTNNTMTGNSASNGGGVWVSTLDSVTFTNNTMTGNSASNGGGGVYAASPGLIFFANNTITGNSAGDYGGGGLNFYLTYNDDVADIINNIIWNNTATGSANDLYINNDDNGDYFPSTVNFYNNDFDQSAAGTYIQLPFTIDASNLDNEDPLFADAVNGNYHLTGLSPCIDAGRLEEAPSDDMDGDSRPLGTGVDIGADEFDPSAPPTTTSTTTTTSATTTIPISTTTTTSSGGTCLSETIYGEHSDETKLLRHFRDNVLSQTPEGRELIKLYYLWSPVIVKMTEENAKFKEEVKEIIDGVLMLLAGGTE